MSAPKLPVRNTWLLAAALVTASAGLSLMMPWESSQASEPAAAPAAAPAAVSVSVAKVEASHFTNWAEFSGHLDAINRVEVRPRVSGMLLSRHFTEGALVNKGDLLLTLDPAPFAAEVARAKADVAAAKARQAQAHNDYDRAQGLWKTKVIAKNDLDQRQNAALESDAELEAAKAQLQTAELNLSYTQVKAPIAGRIGKLTVTEGNLVAAGPSAQALTSIVSVDPIYASFDADEQTVMRALSGISAADRATSQYGAVAVELGTAATDNTPILGKLQWVDNQIDPGSGTIRLRAQFSNAGATLIPGQFVRLRLGQAQRTDGLLITERALGTDQDKKYVLVVGTDNKVQYREVQLGDAVGDLRLVKSGLKAGESIVVSGLQRVRPGMTVAPQTVPMEPKA
ncbi:efflux RND transporter periplasmic adaptor subunit [Gallaecimonas pentaromativorans]|uniref:Multidrug efflux system membrane fusion protein n=1 Tax=Gallaecimonas pentaromativorans TaxID=584787 RepID=A0A3N1NWD2_9GAMM|nr:efflux RND transporter periplasmic adaptor subunit [Gallaecimonas pentaromativorans]ROQ24144.1 multidrug efflux system membrane fusion protein [Gallaecimonas pentaromativorans]